MPYSHHSHSGQFCRHAKDTLESIVVEAVRQKIHVYGLTEHCPRYRIEDLFPEEVDLQPADLYSTYISFLEEATRLQQAYIDRISLLIGIETESISPLDSIRLSELVEGRTEIQYIVGSVHHVHGISIDFDRSTCLRSVRAAMDGTIGTTMSSSPSGSAEVISLSVQLSNWQPSTSELEPFLNAYFDSQYTLFQTHQPEVIGHFDLCLLYTPTINLSSMEKVWEKVRRNVEFVVGYGGLFEANSAAIRKGWSTSYPKSEALKLILELGGRICLSDDSHGVAYVGLNYPIMRDYLLQSGVEEIWYLVPASQAQNGDKKIGTRGRVVARPIINPDWTSDPFWPEQTP